jgi:hypothetical protein
VLVPGLLAAGVGSLIFIGLDHLTGLGTFSLAIPGLPHVGSPTGAEFLWALAIGVMAALAGSGIRWLGLFLRPHVERRILLATPVVGLASDGLQVTPLVIVAVVVSYMVSARLAPTPAPDQG